MARRVKAKHGFTAWAMVVYAFLYLPILVMVIFAFNKPSAPALAAYHGSNVCDIPPAQIGNITVWNGFTSCWFSAGLHDPTYIPAIVVSLQIAAVASIIATLLGLGAALALARMKPRLRAPFDVLVYLTLVVPEIVIAVASLIFFVQARNYFHAFPALGKGTILLGQVVFSASVAMLIIRARFVGMGDSLEEAAYDLGSGPLATFRQVTLPRLMPAIVGRGPAVLHLLVRRLRPACFHQRHDQYLARSCCSRPCGSASPPRSTPSPRSCSASPCWRSRSPRSSCAVVVCKPPPAKSRRGGSDAALGLR